MDRKRLVWIAVVAGALLTTLDLVLAYTVASPVLSNLSLSSGAGAVIGGKLVEHPVLFSQKIFYFHVPVAIASFGVFFFTALYGARFLMTRDRKYDTRARIATEVTLVFVVLTMITGDIWTRLEWGVWWVWEPRLTTYFILMMLVIVYFVLRASIEDEERRAVYAAAFGILAFLDAPLSFAITRLIPSGVHPVVFTLKGSSLAMTQLAPFLLGLFGMLFVAYSIYQMRLREELVKERIEVLKAAYEE